MLTYFQLNSQEQTNEICILIDQRSLKKLKKLALDYKITGDKTQHRDHDTVVYVVCLTIKSKVLAVLLFTHSQGKVIQNLQIQICNYTIHISSYTIRKYI